MSFEKPFGHPFGKTFQTVFGDNVNFPESLGLATWLEGADGVTIVPTNLVSNWADQSGNDNDASQSINVDRPFYDVSGVNGLPDVDFDGANEFMNIDWTILAGTNFTIYAVVERSSNQNLSMIMGTGDATFGESLHFGWRSDAEFTLAFWGSDLNLAVDGFDAGTVTIVKGGFSTTAGQSLRLIEKGVLKTASAIGMNTPLVGGTLGRLGWGVGNITMPFGGSISEVLILLRATTVTEDSRIETYLANKYGLALP